MLINNAFYVSCLLLTFLDEFVELLGLLVLLMHLVTDLCLELTQLIGKPLVGEFQRT
jgi:hypothetical protein